MIFKHLFDSTRLTFGTRQINHFFRNVIPARNALAILRVCHQIYDEAGDLWISRVLFNFEDGMTLMDKLSSIPYETLIRIRHVRTRMLDNEPGAPDGMEEPVVHGLQMLRGLKLDRLSLVAPWGLTDYSKCDDFARFTDEGFPCKELCMITPTSPFHHENGSTPAEVTQALQDFMTFAADCLQNSYNPNIQVTVAVIQSMEPYSAQTCTVYDNSALTVLEETPISTTTSLPDMVASGNFGKTLKHNVETMVVFKPNMMNSDSYNTTRGWYGDLREEYLLGREEDDILNMTTGDLFPWPHQIKPRYVILDQYNNIDDIIWPGKHADQAWEGALN